MWTAIEPSPPVAAPAALAHKIPARASPALRRAACDFVTSAVSGSAGLSRLPLPRVYGAACLSSQRPPRTILNDVHRYCVSQNLDPVISFSI
jgi:hypothetical protein